MFFVGRGPPQSQHRTDTLCPYTTLFQSRTRPRSPHRGPDVRIHPEVATALADGRAVVALESTIISHGLPQPDNLEVARGIEARVRDSGAVPATIAVVDGTVHIGIDDAALHPIARAPDVAKASSQAESDVGTEGGRK